LILIVFAAFGIKQADNFFQAQNTQTPSFIECPFDDTQDFSVEDEYWFILGFTPNNSEIFYETQYLPCGEIRKYIYPTVENANASFEEYKQHTIDIMPKNVELLDTDSFFRGIKISIPHSTRNIVAVTEEELGSQYYLINTITIVNCDEVISFFVVDPIQDVRDFSTEVIVEIVQESFNDTLVDECK